MEKNNKKQEIVLYLDSGKSIIIDVAPLKLIFEKDEHVKPEELLDDLYLARESMYSSLNSENAGSLIEGIQQSNFTIKLLCSVFKQMTWRAEDEKR